MPDHSRYPDNWNEIALVIKKKANWTCSKCQRKCLQPGTKAPKDWSASQRHAYTLQVHHWDRMPENCSENNLVAVCSPCHLQLHIRGLSNVSQGQLSLQFTD